MNPGLPEKTGWLPPGCIRSFLSTDDTIARIHAFITSRWQSVVWSACEQVQKVIVGIWCSCEIGLLCTTPFPHHFIITPSSLASSETADSIQDYSFYLEGDTWRRTAFLSELIAIKGHGAYNLFRRMVYYSCHVHEKQGNSLGSIIWSRGTYFVECTTTSTTQYG